MADFNLGRLKFNWKGAWGTTTSYVKDDVVRKDANTYICLTAHTSGVWATDLAATKWELMVPGTTGSATTTDGDMVFNDMGTDVRLPIGTTGQALIVDDTGHPAWTNLATADSIYYVKADGDDTNNGTNLNEAFRTIRHACDTVTGPATIYVKGGLYYEVLPIKVPANVTIVGDGQRTTGVAPVNITNNSASINATTGAQTSTTIVIDDSADVGGTWTIGDTITVSTITNGGSGISGTITITAIAYDTPIAGNSTITVSFSSQTVTATDCTISSDHSDGTMWQLNDGATLNKMYFKGMQGFEPNLSTPEDITTATIAGVFVALDPDNPIINKSPYVIECAAFSDNGAIGAVVDGDVHATGIKSMVFHGYTIVASDGCGYWVNGQGKAEIVSCFTYYCWYGYTTTNGGKIRALNGNNSYGTYGVVSRGYDPDETPVTGALYGRQLTYNELTLTGEFLAGQTIVGNLSGATGTVKNVQGAVSKLYYINTNGSTFQNGEDITSTGAITGSTTYGSLTGTSVTASATYTAVSQKSTSGIGRGAVFTIAKTGSGTSYSGVTTITMTTAGAGYEVGDTITIAGNDLGGSNTTNDLTFTLGTSVSTTGATVTLASDGVSGQKGFVLVADGFSEAPRPGAAVSIAGDTYSYIIQSVSGSYVNSSSVMIIVLANEKPAASDDNAAVTIRYAYSNARLTGHDFLSIGTGDKITTNYPGEPTQAASQANEVIESYPGRVFYVSTDQDGNFRVGDYFRVDQATGRATLNANAFDLSGLTSLRLGSIGAQLGELVNEFSSDYTLSGDSNEAVPTEAAVRGYFENIATNVVPTNDNILTLGTPSNRWNHVYVGPGSITLGTLTITDNAGTLEVKAGANPAGAAINAISNGTSNVSVAEDGDVTVTTNGGLALTIDANGDATFEGSVTVNGGATTLSSTEIVIADAALYLADGNTADLLDIGVMANITKAPTGYQHVGLVRDATDGVWKLFSGVVPEPTTTVDFTSAVYDPLHIGALTSAAITASGTTAINASGGITTDQTTFPLINTTATTVNFAGAATSLNVGANSGTLTIGNPTVVGTQTTQALYNTTATTVNFAGAGTTINIGANSGTLTIGNPTVVGTQTTQALYNTTATTVNFAGAATSLNMGASTGTTTVNNDLNLASGKVYKVGSSEVLGKSKLTLNGSSSGTVAFQAAAAAGSVTYTLPSADAGASGYALTSNGSGTLSWSNVVTTISDDTSTNSTYYPTFVTATSGNASTVKVSSSKFTFNPSTGTLSATIVTASSDARLKENVRPIEGALTKVLALEGVLFNRIGSTSVEVGVIAQQVETVVPELVFTDADGMKSVAYGNTVALLIEAIKEQQVQINELKAKLN